MRNKKKAASEPSPEQTAIEQHVEALMNPNKPDAPKTVPASAAAPLDIFQGLPAEKVPLSGAVKAVSSAPTVPGKPLPKPTDGVPAKSLFSSVDALRRSDSPAPAASQPITIKPKLTSRAVPIDLEPTAPVTKGTPIVAVPPKPITLGSNPTRSAAVGEAVNVEKLARKEAFTDAATESAVADIVAKEGDDLLEAEDKARKQAAVPTFKKPQSRMARLRKVLTSKWVLLTIPLLLIALFAVPVTRYKIASLIIKRELVVTVLDSQTGKPVSGALITYNDVSAKTNANGQAPITVPLGKGSLAVSKGYYAAYSGQQMVGFGDTMPTASIKLLATGRQVPLVIMNKLTKKPLAGATVKVLNTSAVSDKAGKVALVLPTKTATAKATVSANGFNDLSIDVEITDAVVTANTINLVPAGSLYFVANNGGKLDVVKTNLDGSERKVVLAATGNEDPATTSIVASRDWKFVAVRSRRTANQTSLSLIDTSTDKVTEFEQAIATYTPIGWSGHNFVYDVVRTQQNPYQSGRESLKSYNADQQQPNQLDQTTALGTAAAYAAQSFNNYFIVDTQLVYNVQWTAAGSPAYDLTSQTNAIRSISAAGSGKKDLQTYAAAGLASFQAAHVLPGTIDYSIATTDNKTTFYAYANGAITSDGSVTAANFTPAPPVYLLSPDGTRSFWTDTKSGKNNLTLGDKNATGPSVISPSSEYTAYGWYGAGYLLYSRSASGLYIVPINGTTIGTPIKVSDYSQKVTAPSVYGGGF